MKRTYWVLVLTSALLFGGCANGGTDAARAACGATNRSGVNAVSANTNGCRLLEDRPFDDAAERPETDAAEGECGLTTVPAGTEAASPDTALYVSATGDGALLTVRPDGNFVYRIARRYTCVADADITFDLRFTLTGTLVDGGQGTLFGVETATVACTRLSNAEAAVSALETNGKYGPGAISLNERMLTGEALTLDEFLGSGAFAALTAEPRYVTIDAAAGSFSLDRPLYPLG